MHEQISSDAGLAEAGVPIEILNTEKLELQERCGIVALFSAHPTKQLEPMLMAAGGVQHRGQHGVGYASWSEAEQHRKPFTHTGLVLEAFTPHVFKRLNVPSNWSLFHCRYGTDGGYDEGNLQPVQAVTPDGQHISVIHNGQFVDTAGMRALLHKDISETASDTVLFTQLLAQSEESSWDEKILHTIDMVKGAYSVVVGVNGAIYAMRDEFGIRPLILGNVPGVGYMIASETNAFDKVGGHVLRQLNPGEVIRIDVNDLTVLRQGITDAEHSHGCDIEWAYFSHPSSLFPLVHGEGAERGNHQWESYQQFRHNCGIVVARESPIPNADFVIGVPDSGIAFANGYASAMKLPYQPIIYRDHFDKNGRNRLFLMDHDKAAIRTNVLGKLLINPDRALWEGKIVVLGDDSIIRGSVSAAITRAIFSLGAREVHWVVGFPPVVDRCHLGVSIRTHEELVAQRHDGDEKRIAQAIGATSVHYISPRGFLAAKLHTDSLQNPQQEKNIFLANQSCGGCVTGVYPIGAHGEIYQNGGIV